MSVIDEQHHELKSLVSGGILERYLLVEKEVFAINLLQSSLVISNQFRYQRNNWTDSTLCYNEISSISFLQLIVGLKEFDIGFDENSVFVDVGCGIGKTLIIVAILNTFKRAIGIDICDGFYKKSVENYRLFATKFRSPLDQTEIEVLEGDGTFWDWSFANLVFIQATNFSIEMMERITNIAKRLDPGGVIIVVGRRLIDESYFDLMGTSKVDYAFGKMSAHIYKKNSKGLSNDVESLRNRLHQILKKQLL